MRLSVYDEDKTEAIAFRGKIYLDEVEQHAVTEADEEQGYLIRYKPDDRLAATERLEGKVRIVTEG